MLGASKQATGDIQEATRPKQLSRQDRMPESERDETSNGNDIKTKAERSFDLGFVFDIEAKQTCLFQNL
jgi:hypothetical protein